MLKWNCAYIKRLWDNKNARIKLEELNNKRRDMGYDNVNPSNSKRYTQIEEFFKNLDGGNGVSK